MWFSRGIQGFLGEKTGEKTVPVPVFLLHWCAEGTSGQTKNVRPSGGGARLLVMH
jgi:hypothetical protein